MSSFLCFLCHSTVNADTSDDIREKYRDVVGIHLYLDSHLCYICCHVLNKLWMFRAVCLRRSLEYPVLFRSQHVRLDTRTTKAASICYGIKTLSRSKCPAARAGFCTERGTLNLQRNDVEIHTICPDILCGQILNTFVESRVFHITHDDTNEFVKLTKDKTNVDEYFQKDETSPNKENILESNAESFNEFLNYSPEISKDKDIEIYSSFNDTNQNVDADIYTDNVTDTYLDTDTTATEETNVTINQVLTGKDEFIGTGISIEDVSQPKKETKDSKRKRRPKRSKKRGFELKTLTLEEQKAELDKRRKEKKYLEAEFKCHNCALAFLFKDTYQTHMMRHEESNGEHRCETCTLRFATPQVLRAHNSNHSERYTCSQCKETMIPRARVPHARRCWNNASDAVSCHLCGGMFQDHAGLQQHLKRVHQSKTSNRSYPCGVCGKSYGTPAAVRNHMIKHINKKFDCNECPATFSSPYTLANHKKRKHSGLNTEQFYCEVCDIAYSSRKSLLAHKRNTLNHQQTIYECPLCSRACPNQRSLAAHMESVHSASKNYQCQLCPARYTNRKSLVRHMGNHEGKGQPGSVMCHLCGASFKGANKLNRHLREVCERIRMENQRATMNEQNHG